MCILNRDKSEVVLFNLEKNGNLKSYLKDFINCLKYHKLRTPLKFSFVEQDASLIEELSLKNNILLDSIPNSLSNSKEFQLRDYLNKTGNLNLVKLYKQVPDWDRPAKDASLEDKKIASLIKAKIHPNDIIFLEFPEKHLSPFQTKLLTHTITYAVKNSNKTIFLRSNLEDIWSDLITKTIVKSKNGRFEIHDYKDAICDSIPQNGSKENGLLVFNNLNGDKDKAA